MSEALVVGLTFGISYAAIVGYAVYLHRRRRRAGS
jgi:hypothetical protein